jgi:hypothetical protein
MQVDLKIQEWALSVMGPSLNYQELLDGFRRNLELGIHTKSCLGYLIVRRPGQ